MKIERSLYPHQSTTLDNARSEFARGFRCVMIQSPTGTGKTRMQCSTIAKSATATATRKALRVWLVVPRNELVWQSSLELEAWGIRHGTIDAKNDEQSVFKVHVCSRDTLIRRIKQHRIKNWPDIIHIDEGHLGLDIQLKIKEAAADSTTFLGWTATPERLDGRPLKGMWETLVEADQLQWFVEHGYLKRPLVYSIPKLNRLAGLSDLKISGEKGDVDKKGLLELYQARAKGQKVIFGNEIEHYRKFGLGRSFLDFHSSIILAEKAAEDWKSEGFNVDIIDGRMTVPQRKKLINSILTGERIGLTTVDLCVYGLDVPKISCIMLNRYTASLAMFLQMIGRGLRWDGENKDCLIFDFVGNCDDTNHGHPLTHRIWNFKGNERKKKPKDAIARVASVKQCTVCYCNMIDENGRDIDYCPYDPSHVQAGASKNPLKEVDGWLVPITEPTPLKERPVENQREYQHLINTCRDNFRRDWEEKGEINEESVKNLLGAAKDIGYQPLWCYHYLNRPDLSVNYSLLMMIQKIKKYKHGWAYYKRSELEGRKTG